MSLLRLLPFLAVLASAAPRQVDNTQQLDARGPYGATPLQFQAMGDMGISAQMVRTLIKLAHLQC